MSRILSRSLSRRAALSTAAKVALGIGISAIAAGTGYYAYMNLSSNPPQKPDRLIIRTWGDPFDKALMDAVGNEFQRLYGIRIEFDYTEDNEIQPKLLQAVRTGSQPPIDINWTTSVNAMQEALWGIPKELTVDDVPNLADMKPMAKPDPVQGYGEWPFVNIYVYTTSLAYRTDKVSKPPDSWLELWDQKYIRAIALYDDGFGFNTVLAKLAGLKIPDELVDDQKMEKAWDLLRRLKPNIGGLGEDPDHFNWLMTGQFKFFATLTANALAAKNEGAPVSWVVPAEGVDVQSDALYILKNLPPEREFWAKRFINMALSAESQTKLSEVLGLPALHKNTSYPDWMDNDPASPTRPEDFQRMIVVPLRIRVEHEKKWFAKFEEIMSV